MSVTLTVDFFFGSVSASVTVRVNEDGDLRRASCPSIGCSSGKRCSGIGKIDEREGIVVDRESECDSTSTKHEHT